MTSASHDARASQPHTDAPSRHESTHGHRCVDDTLRTLQHAAGNAMRIDDAACDAATHAAMPPAYTGEYYTLGQFGKLRITISYYIDALTVCMFCMVTFIATCIHFYAIGYMHDELHDVTTTKCTLSDGQHLHRPGRFHRFFQYLSLFCFSMLGWSSPATSRWCSCSGSWSASAPTS